MSVGKFLAGFVIGASVGAIAGLLLAPQSGEETRELIAESSKDLYDKAQDSIAELQDKATDVMENLQEKGDEIIDKLQKFAKKADKEA